MKIFIGIFLLLILIILTSKLKIDIVYIVKPPKKLRIDFKINVGIFIFGIIKIIELTFTEKYIKFLVFKIPYTKLKFDKKIFKIIKDISILDILKILNQKLEKINIKIIIGLEDVMALALIISSIEALFNILIGVNYKNIKIKNCNYSILPTYNKNELYLDISAIISFKLINILKSFIYIKKNNINNLEKFNIDNFV